MANNNKGKYHSLGYVRGSLYYGILSLIGSFVLFYITFRATGSQKTFLFIGLSLFFFAISNFSLYLFTLNFGMGSGKIIHSYNKSKDDNPTLFIVLKVVGIISSILTIVFIICIFTIY